MEPSLFRSIGIFGEIIAFTFLTNLRTLQTPDNFDGLVNFLRLFVGHTLYHMLVALLDYFQLGYFLQWHNG